MSEKKKYKLQDYLDYLKGKSSGQERHELERSLEADPFEREAMEGLETIPPEEVEADLLSLHERLTQRLNREQTRSTMGRRRRIRLYSIAASVASLLIVGSIFLKIHDFNPPSELEMQEQAVREFQETEAANPPAEAESLTEQDEPVMEQEEAVTEQSPVRKRSRLDKGQVDQGSPEGKQDSPPETVVAEVATPLLDEEAAEGLADEYIVVEEAEPRAEMKARSRTGEENREEFDFIMEQEVTEEDKAMELPAPVAAAPREKKGLDRNEMARTAGFSQEESDLVNGRVSGVVLYAEDMEPLPGATVMFKNADTGVSTDLMGRFSLPVKEDTSTLVAAFVGMETEEYQVMAGKDNKLLMHPSVMSLDEVVVIRGMSSDYQDTNHRYTPAEPLEGYWAYRNYIEENLRIPETLTEGKQVVILNFILTADGRYENFVAARSPGPEFTDEAIRLIREGPEWKVAENLAGPMDELVRMRIVFKK